MNVSILKYISEIKYVNIFIFRPLSQSQDFIPNLELNLVDSFNSTPFLTTAIDDFNAKSNKRSGGDRSTSKEKKLNFALLSLNSNN